MYCRYCGTALKDNILFCTNCGAQIKPTPNNQSPQAVGRIGYSERIHDPAFARYLKNTNRWSALFSMILAIATVIGFTIYGETSREMENPQAMFIGLGIGGMFLLIALYSIIARKASKTWDGVVVDKTVKQKSRRHDTGNNDSTIHYYTEYTVIMRDERGKTHRMTAEDDRTVFDYFQVGDRVRHHAGLNSYEKYDKSRDSIIFCNACATLCDITDDVCFRCNCPLLK
ncbi:MAG: zinc ribbon domain-containing protein [Angelakisella sp.]|nr:zinc ribbon domain-containing protein [Angelakisella sp.]